jgi:hypothetical protein
MLVYTVRNSLLIGSSSDQWLRFPYISVHFMFGSYHELHMLHARGSTNQSCIRRSTGGHSHECSRVPSSTAPWPPAPDGHDCNIIEAPTLGNGGHGASLRHHEVTCTRKLLRALARQRLRVRHLLTPPRQRLRFPCVSTHSIGSSHHAIPNAIVYPFRRCVAPSPKPHYDALMMHRARHLLATAPQ